MRVTQFVALAALGTQCTALLEERIVAFESARAGSLPFDIASASILVAVDDFKGVQIAATTLVSDFGAITGTEPRLVRIGSSSGNASVGWNSTIGWNTTTASSAVIVGSLDSTLIRRLVADGLLDVSDIEGKWESWKTAVVDKALPGISTALVIAGSDKRGTVFGIHTLAEQSGQSPYHWFADVPAKKHKQIFALRKTTTFGSPSVKYRGLFINDEEPALNTWWAERHNATRYPLNTEFYSHVFDLLLRLKANYLWPAMWKSWTPPPGNIFFTDDPGNQQLANDYGIVIGTAHHEPMHRATNEWDEAVMGPWNWSKNKANMTSFMEEGIRRAGNNESYISIGLRGLGDEAAVTANAVEMLRGVFQVQRDIIAKYHGSPSAVNQVWALYKEVASYYAAGLDAPPDVTILFPDDNQGNIYRLPTNAEVGRPGGHGIYFHLEYIGSPKSYKWANTNNLPKILKELQQSYLRGADRQWVINVGDIKPMELPFGFSMDLAWNVSSITFETLPQYIQAYAAREFGDEHAEEIADILLEHSHLIGMRRYEMVHSGTFSAYNYHEAERMLARWAALAVRVKALYNGGVTADVKAAFFQLVYHPVVSGATYYNVQLGVALNYKFAQERRNSANLLADKIREDFDASYDLIEEWDANLGGKWKNMMSQAVYDAYANPKLWANPTRDILANLSYVQLRQDLQYALGNMGIYAEESINAVQQGRWSESVDSSMPNIHYTATLPTMDPYGPASRSVDVFHRGNHKTTLSWTLDKPPVDWVTVFPTSGTLGGDTMDQRLNVTIDWAKVPQEFNDTVKVGIRSTPAKIPYFDYIYIPVSNFRVPVGFKGYPETAGFVSIESPHFQRSSSPSLNTTSSPSSNSTTDVHFAHIPLLGTRSESGSIALRPFTAARRPNSAWVEYAFFLFSDAPSVDATVYINANLDTDPTLKMQFSLTLDSAPANFTRVLGDYVWNSSVGDIPPEWMENVVDQVWTKKVKLGKVEKGAHTLKWMANSPEVYLEKIVLDTHGGVKGSYLGPPETTRVG